MRITLHEPSGGIAQLSAHLLSHVLLAVGADVPAEVISRWTELERLVAYDWAYRAWIAATEDQNIKRRPIPYFIARETQE